MRNTGQFFGGFEKPFEPFRKFPKKTWRLGFSVQGLGFKV